MNSKISILTNIKYLSVAICQMLIVRSASINDESANLAKFEKYLGKHIYTQDFQFQEKVRQLDLTIKEMVKETISSKFLNRFFIKDWVKTSAEIAQRFFVNGWGQIFASAYLLQKSKISFEFRTYITEKIEEALNAAGQQKIYVNANVRSFTKDILMYPHAGKFYPFQKIELDEPVAIFNKLLASCEFEYRIFGGKLYLMVNSSSKNLFEQVWEGNLPKILEQNNFIEMAPNRESSHVTLINSNVVADIQKMFKDKFGVAAGLKKFDNDFSEILSQLNKLLSEESTPLIATHLSSTYSEDYTPFEEVVVVNLQSNNIKKSLQMINDTLEKILEKSVNIKVQDSFHVTIGVRYRKSLTDVTNINEIIDNCGTYDLFFKDFLNQLTTII